MQKGKYIKYIKAYLRVCLLCNGLKYAFNSKSLEKSVHCDTSV